MNPMRRQGVKPWAFAGQGTTHNPEALAFPFDLPVMLAEPLPHRVAAVPRGIIPHQQQSGLAQGSQPGTDPGQEGDRPPNSPVGRPRSAATHALGALLGESALGGAGHNRPGLWGQDRWAARVAQRAARAAGWESRHAARAAPPDSTTSHLQSPAPTRDGSPPSGSGGHGLFFADIGRIGTGNPPFGPLPAHVQAAQGGTDRFAADPLGSEALGKADLGR
jgi:hypothetical protein